MADILSALVHELRTPLTALRGSLDLLAGAMPDGAEDAQEFTDIASRNAVKLSALLDAVAVYARLRSPDAPLAVAPLDLALLLERAAERVQRIAEERGVTVEIELPAFDATANEDLLGDAVARLLFYAVRVTPKGGRVRASAENAGGRVVIRVRDEGRAVPEGAQDQVFEPFSLVARRGVDSADRAGLDLAIAALVAGRHGGFMEYRQLTAGGVIRLAVPAAP